MKIVVLDGYTLNPGDLSWSDFEKLGDFTCYDRTPDDTVVNRIGDADVVITNKTPLTKKVLDACPNIKYIGVLATGYNVVDTNTAKQKGILVTNVPTYGTTAVSQYVFALLLEICHRVQHHSNTVKELRWSNSQDFCYWDYPLIELSGLTMGIIGFGRIGQNTAKIANAFGMNVLAYDSFENKDLETSSMKYTSFEDLCAKSDVISLHCPLLPSTKDIINEKSIASMKDGVIIINTSRGPLVVEEDMLNALESNKVSFFAADVVSTEPIKPDNVLLGAPNCLITPHIAWAPKAARRRLMDVASSNLVAYANDAAVNLVNP